MTERFKEGDKVIIATKKELGLFRFSSMALTFDKDSKATLVAVVEAIEGQEFEGEPIGEVCVSRELLEHA